MKALVASSRDFWVKLIKNKKRPIAKILAIGLFLFNTEILLTTKPLKFFSKIFKIKRYRTSKKNYEHTQDNFYEIKKNTFYRSKQLYHKRLDYYLKRFKIKTIINLRGVNSDKAWWNKEQEVIRKNNAKMYNIAMSARRFTTKEEVNQLLYIYKIAKRPILIHCLGGADRTGEASALWLLTQQNKSIKEAMKQLSHKFGHISFFYPKKKQFINLFVSSSHNPYQKDFSSK